MSGENYHVDGLRKNTVWFSNVEQLNDPYEGRIYFEQEEVSIANMKSALTQIFYLNNNDLKKSRREVEDRFKKMGKTIFTKHIHKNVSRHFHEFLKTHHKERHVLSLSKANLSLKENLFPEPLSLMMMWAHYANGFRGFCIEYDYSKLIKSINKINDIRLDAREVEYVKSNLPIIKSSTVIDDIIYKNNKTSKEIIKAYATKHKAWDYENEVRVISPIQGINKYSEECVNRVFVSELNPSLMDDVKIILREKKHNPELYQVSLHKKKFGFVFIKVDY